MFSILTFLFSCNTNSVSIIEKGGKVYEVSIPDHNKLTIISLENGELVLVNNISIDNNHRIQELYLDSIGFLKSKIIQSTDRKLIDRQYYFYENSVDLKTIETFKNDKKNGVGITFYKGGLPGRIKIVSNYNNEGYLYSRKFYDPEGNSLRIENTETGFSEDVIEFEK